MGKEEETYWRQLLFGDLGAYALSMPMEELVEEVERYQSHTDVDQSDDERG